MKTITVRRLDLQFDADQVTAGPSDKQADQAIDAINQVLQREPFGLGAQLYAHRDEIEVDEEDAPTDGNEGFVGCLAGTIRFGPGWDKPLPEEDWEALRTRKEMRNDDTRTDQQAEYPAVLAGACRKDPSPQVQPGGGVGLRPSGGGGTGEAEAGRPQPAERREDHPVSFYVLVVWEDIEPELVGAFTTEEERDQRAKELKAEHGNDHGIFPLNINDKGEPEVDAYAGGFFMEVLE